MLPRIPPLEPHPALATPEIILHVFQQLDASDLLSTALVCKDWRWKATDTRWRVHPVGVIQLLATLAPFKFNRENGEVSTLRTRFERDFKGMMQDIIQITHEEWANFSEHARKVTHLELDSNSAILVSFLPPWAQDLAPFCPACTRMTFSAGWHPGLKHLKLWGLTLNLMVPSVSCINIMTSDWVDEATGWLEDEATSRTPLITVATFHVRKVHPTYARYPGLRKLSLRGEITVEGWMALSIGCPELEDLHVEVLCKKSHPPSGFRAEDIPTFAFASLRKFSFALIPNTWRVMHVYTIICHSKMPVLQRLKFSRTQWLHNNLDNIVSAITECASLEELEIDMGGDDERLSAMTMSDIVTLTRLRSLNAVHRLAVHNTSTWLNMQDADWEVLTERLPRLKDLVIEQEPGAGPCRHWTRCTLRSLQSLDSALHLEHLTISILATPSSLELPISPLHTLRSLTFQHLEVEDGFEFAFARFINVLCPNLDEFNIHCFQLRSDGTYRAGSSAELEAAVWADQRFRKLCQRRLLRWGSSAGSHSAHLQP
ncbi:hypothetical protein FRB94_009123 [Tulasnella sp. JGI-2019a]|nr:hypothetical protein FRB94_009123 [Tulasnella sp. JGI-2019a]